MGESMKSNTATRANTQNTRSVSVSPRASKPRSNSVQTTAFSVEEQRQPLPPLQPLAHRPISARSFATARHGRWT